MWLIRAYRDDDELAAEQPLGGLTQGDLERRLGFAPTKLGSTPLDPSQLAALADMLRPPVHARLHCFLDFDANPHSAREFDSVEVLTELGEHGDRTFPAGTRAAIIDMGPDYALVEVVEEDGRAYGPYAVALSDLRRVAHAPARRRARKRWSPFAHRAA